MVAATGVVVSDVIGQVAGIILGAVDERGLAAA
jgi:hypothetical protein